MERRGIPGPVLAEQRRLRLALALFGTVILVGWLGYQLVSGLSPLDSLYMTISTISTVGFEDLTEPTVADKLLTIGLITGGVGTATYAALTAAEYVYGGHLYHYLETRRMDRSIGALDGHVIVCGFGRVGRHLAGSLALDASDFVVVDNDEDKAEEAQAAGYLVLQGDASAESVLHAAGIERASALVAAVNSDADNVLVTLTAKGLRPDCTVIARAKLDETVPKLRRAGADRVISPSTIGGRRIAQILTRPAVADFLDNIGAGAVDYTLEEVPVHARDGLAGETLRDAAIRERFGCTVLAIRHVGQAQLDSHPSPTVPLVEGDVLVVMGSQEDVTAMRRSFVRG
jgi:voltage-gated potassium channel